MCWQREQTRARTVVDDNEFTRQMKDVNRHGILSDPCPEAKLILAVLEQIEQDDQEEHTHRQQRDMHDDILIPGDLLDLISRRHHDRPVRIKRHIFHERPDTCQKPCQNAERLPQLERTDLLDVRRLAIITEQEIRHPADRPRNCKITRQERHHAHEQPKNENNAKYMRNLDVILVEHPEIEQ